MKYLIVISILFTSVSYGQNKIDGIGPFKIGKTLASQLPTFADTSAGRLKKRLPEKVGTDYWYAGWYFLGGMWVEDLSLTFFKDTLYSIECRWGDSLQMALKAKYGNGRSYYQEKVITCRTGLKIVYTEKERSLITSYPTVSGNISAFSILESYFDENCQKQQHTIYRIEHLPTARKVDKINSDFLKRQEAERLKKEKEKFKDF